MINPININSTNLAKLFYKLFVNPFKSNIFFFLSIVSRKKQFNKVIK